MVRFAAPEDAGQIAGLLHEFNLEFGEASPGVGFLEPRVRAFVESGAKRFLVACGPAGEPDGFAQVEFRSSVWFEGPVALLEELYVVPDRRGNGLGRELMDAVLSLAREQGAEMVEVITGEDDTAARGLYESTGFRNRIEGEQNTSALYYELEL